MGYSGTPMSYEEINSRRRTKGVFMNLCTGCDEPTVVPPSRVVALCKRCFELRTSQPQSDKPTSKTETTMRRTSAYEELVWTDDEEPGVVKTQKQPTKKAKIETERAARFCTSCNREKQSSDFDDGKKTCRACLDAQRWKRARDGNILEQTGRILGPNPPQGNRSGLRRESPIEIPSPPEVVKECEQDPKGKVSCEECRKRRKMCMHTSGLDAVNGPGETSKTSLNTTLPLLDVGVKGSTGTESLQTINNETNKSGSLHSTKQTDESALDKELKEVAHKATMRALKRKLEEAEKIEKKAKATLAETQTTKKALRGRIQDLNKQEVRNRTAAFEAHKHIDEIKLRIAQQERALKSN